TPGNVSPYQVFEYGEPSLLGDHKILDPPKIRAIADNLMSQNPDGFAFYNFYTFDFGEYYPDLRTWTTPRRTEQMSKHYLNCRRLMYHPNERETFDIGVAFERHLLQEIGDSVELPFRFSTDIVNSVATLRCAFEHMRETDDIVVRVNGCIMTPDTVKSKTIQSEGNPDCDVRIWESAIAMPPLQLGDNAIQWELIKRESDNRKAIAVGEFEIVIDP
ncbi:MAG: hypothetical protein KAJ12_12985, partial [Bacteroidetes bacterium]|nr:hypothetical protein [Bacteroidota bacterium]